MAKTRELYSVHPSIQLVEDWVASLKTKTGRSLDEWMKFIKKNGPPTEEARRDWLKKEHGLGTNSAWWLAERAAGKGGDDTRDGYLRAAPRYVETMYRGKEALKPLHDRLIEMALGLGKDVKICPCATIVPIYREHVVAQVKPSTKTRIDFGFALGPMLKAGKKPPPRLIDTGGFAKKDRITHKIEVTSEKDVDTDLKKWLVTAYELDAPGKK